MLKLGEHKTKNENVIFLKIKLCYMYSYTSKYAVKQKVSFLLSRPKSHYSTISMFLFLILTLGRSVPGKLCLPPFFFLYPRPLSLSAVLTSVAAAICRFCWRCEKGGTGEGSGEAEPASLASLVESTFVMAAAGNSYQEGLKSFIATIKEAYERGYTVPALTMEVSFVPTKVRIHRVLLQCKQPSYVAAFCVSRSGGGGHGFCVCMYTMCVCFFFVFFVFRFDFGHFISVCSTYIHTIMSVTVVRTMKSTPMGQNRVSVFRPQGEGGGGRWFIFV